MAEETKKGLQNTHCVWMTSSKGRERGHKGSICEYHSQSKNHYHHEGGNKAVTYLESSIIQKKPFNE